MARALQEAILAELPREQQEAARQAVLDGHASNEREGVTFILEHPEYIWKATTKRRGLPVILLGGSGILFALSLTYYLRKRST